MLLRVRARTCLSALAVLSLLPACSSTEEVAPVATVSLTLNKDRVPLGGPLELTYRFEPAAPIAGDYRVFSHVVAPDGTQMWTDDHDPTPPTSAWKAGEPVEYTRTVFVPLFPYLGEATIRVGLHRGADRLPLLGGKGGGTDVADMAYTVASLELLPQSESVFLIYGNGWYGAEYAADDPNRSWQWTQKTAVLTFRNPRQDATLFLQYDGRTDAFGDKPQEVTISVGAKAVDTFRVDNRDPVLRRINLTANDLGTNDTAEIRIGVDRTFSPASIGEGADLRELGIRVYHVFVEPR